MTEDQTLQKDFQNTQARYRLFDQFALKDQKVYYERTIEKNRKAGAQVNQYRALFAFLTGLCAALAGLVAQSMLVDSATCGIGDAPGYCNAVEGFAILLAIFAIVFPAFGTFFSTLSDLFQWDKLTSIYQASLDNLEVADSLSPSENIPPEDFPIYKASVYAFAEGALNVMRDETAQWGQAVRTPAQLEEFIAKEREKAAQASGQQEE